MILRNFLTGVIAISTAIISTSAFSGISTPPDEPSPTCLSSGDPIPTPLPPNYLVYRVRLYPDEAGGCPGTLTRDPEQIYQMLINYDRTKRVRSYTSCIRESYSLRCYGSPIASSPTIKYRWEIKGPLTITYPSTPQVSDNVLIGCAGIGTGTLWFKAMLQDGNTSTMTSRTFTCSQ